MVDQVNGNLASVAAKGDPTSVGTVPTPEEIVAIVSAAGKVTNQAPPNLADNRKLTEDIAELFAEMNMSPEFVTKATALVEAYVAEAAAKANAAAEEKYSALSEAYKTELQEDTVNKLNEYTTYAAKQWLVENVVAVESGLKLEAADRLLNGLKNLVVESAVISITEEEETKFNKLVAENTALKAQLNEAVTINMEASKVTTAQKRAAIVEEVSAGLTAVDKSRLVTIAESVEAADLETYKAKITAIAESYIPANKATKPQTLLTESVAPAGAEAPAKNPTMSSYIANIRKLNVN